MTEQIMGQDVNSLLTIKDNSVNGRISFFTVIIIMLICYVLYHMAVIIWSVKKAELLAEYKSELYKMARKSNVKENAPLTRISEPRKINDIPSKPKDKDVEDAMKSLHKFHKKKYL